MQVASDPDNYLARVEHEMRMAQRMQVKVAHEMRSKEMEECTFRPAIHAAPAYVRKVHFSQICIDIYGISLRYHAGMSPAYVCKV